MNLISEIIAFTENLMAVFASFRLSDFLDICFVIFIIFSAIRLIRETRTVQLIKGLILLGIVYLFVSAIGMNTTKYLFDKLFTNVILVIIIVFQPEIRHMIESVGRNHFSGITSLRRRTEVIKHNEKAEVMIDEMCRACSDMSDEKIGALMVIEQETLLGEIINTGTEIDAVITKEMICNVFYPKAPLHDGAAIIRDFRICAAGCFLPLTQNHDTVSSALGTRHRAAIGMSEQSDALVVVVSEETGYISVAREGKLKRNVSDGELREILRDKLLIKENGENDSKLKSFFRRKKK
ncbi:MAG: diadenylate cyclase CdaA [Clostridia bacterium]|nr:diadenylate cyclase CdaA [Clostridia bacterium]